jgi:hypothetical protein
MIQKGEINKTLVLGSLFGCPLTPVTPFPLLPTPIFFFSLFSRFTINSILFEWINYTDELQ